MKWLLIKWHKWWENFHIQLLNDAQDSDDRFRHYMRGLYHQYELNKLLTK